ncbi:peptide-methionine (S)-S-oxide reductase [Stigmatella aurantiaca]|uniref:Peptide methionine sulfoxide reductase MsrA n=1 Tax=Stigmatella aurantiaca TaxID=41 RepID=A0A1H8DMI3_STIAU|nr:peptide-methionine (S)-S-oxide reductase MsrA [Stigmatella aurantiaca]SEN08479.1 peptide-methionine (S)-S-oxide reductase [Stigmatella aurantiaca]
MPSRSTRLMLLALFVTWGGAGALASAPASQDAVKPPARATALFAGGCFWSMELAFDKTPGVVSATSGYSGGTVANPTYDLVSDGTTGHAESVQVVYDPAQVSYAQLLEVFWHNVDPFTANAQFCDRGTEYRTAIFFLDAEQQRLAEASKRRIEASGRFQQPIVTQIAPASAFYPAEEYHQDYARKNPGRYQSYRVGCGRDAHLKALWGDEAPKK